MFLTPRMGHSVPAGNLPSATSVWIPTQEKRAQKCDADTTRAGALESWDTILLAQPAEAAQRSGVTFIWCQDDIPTGHPGLSSVESGPRKTMEKLVTCYLSVTPG
jgi:hypothetical protein